MTMVGGLDVHRQQITFDYVDDDGLVHWGQIRPATRQTLRGWLAEHFRDGDADFALEGCTGWRYVSEELAAAGLGVHLGDPAETAALRGRKKRAKTDRADARLLRTLLVEGRFPESWIPPAHVVEVRTLGRLYCTLMDERRAWQQRIHAQVFHQGCPPIRALLTRAGREALAGAELSAAGRQYVDTALRRIDELSAEIDPLRTQLISFARRQPGCRALQRHYGVGWLCAVIIWAEIGDARRFSSSDQLVRFAGLDVTVYSSDAKRAPGHLSRQGCPELRWAAFEAAKSAARRGSPDHGYYHQLAAKHDAITARTRPWRWSARSCAAAITRCASSAMPPWRCPISDRRRWPPEMRCARALPINQLMPAASSRNSPAATSSLWGGPPAKTERPHPFGSPHAGHPIHHHVAGPRPWTQIRLGAGTCDVVSRSTFFSPRRQQMT